MRPLTFGARLGLLNGVVVLAAILGLGAAGLAWVDHVLVEGAERILLDELTDVETALAELPPSEAALSAFLREEAGGEHIYEVHYRVQVDGVVATSGGGPWALLPPPEDLAPGPTLETVHLAQGRLRVVRDRVELRGQAAVVEVALRLAPEDAAMRQLWTGALVACPLVVALAFIIGRFLARQALRPIDDLERAASRVGRLRPAERLPQTGAGDEVDRLAATLNDMLARLAAAAQRHLSFTSDVAHELRTPLATVRARLDEIRALLRDRGEPLLLERLSAAEQAQARVEGVLRLLTTLSRAEVGREGLAAAPLDLAAAAAEVVEFFAPVAEEAQVRMRLEAAPLVVEAEPAAVSRMLSNLVDNALAQTPAGGEVVVRAREAGGAAILEVADSGPGVPEALRERIFERGFRAGESGGQGIGLAVVRALAQAHGGRCECLAGDLGGSTFRVTLPLDR